MQVTHEETEAQRGEWICASSHSESPDVLTSEPPSACPPFSSLQRLFNFILTSNPLSLLATFSFPSSPIPRYPVPLPRLTTSFGVMDSTFSCMECFLETLLFSHRNVSVFLALHWLTLLSLLNTFLLYLASECHAPHPLLHVVLELSLKSSVTR